MAKLERHVSSHHFASTALLCFGVSCAHKGELTAEESNRIGLRPSEVSATVIDSGVAVCWNRTRREKVAHYKVYRRESAVSSWQQLINTVPTGDDAGTYQFLDQTTRAGAVYVYGVSAEPVSGVEGSISQSHVVQARLSFPFEDQFTGSRQLLVNGLGHDVDIASVANHEAQAESLYVRARSLRSFTCL